MWRGRYCLLLASFVASLLISPTNARPQEPDCPKGPVRFAHCEPNSRNFQTVMIAVHGWNGDCASTFGSENQSIFKVIREPFYDLDCFQYDSKTTALDKNVDLLLQRLKVLHAKGYRQAIFVTHSTGGILALRLLANISVQNGQFASAESAAPLQSFDDKGLRIKAIHAWATPVNGVRKWVSVGGQLVFSPETLPDLKVGSPYLTRLQADLKTLSTLMNAQDSPQRPRLLVPIIFYQGQSADGIVHNIDEQEATKIGWWPYKATIVHTESGHSHNIGASGEIGLPKYPAKLMEARAMLELGLLPRLDDVFPQSLKAVSNSLEQRQLNVVDGIASYAQFLFIQAYTPLADFLKRIVTDAFPRSQNVDERIMRNFARTVEEATGSMTRDLASFCDRLIADIFKGYQTGGSQDLSKFGEGKSAVAQHIVRMLEKIRERVNAYITQDPGGAVALVYSGSLENFNANILRLNSQILASRHDAARTDALRSLQTSIGQYTTAEIKKAELDKTFNTFTAAKYQLFSVEDRELVSKIYGGILNKDSSLSGPTLEFLNKPVRWLNADRPLWTAVLDRDAIRTVLENHQLDPVQAKFTFATGVIKQSDVIASLCRIEVGG